MKYILRESELASILKTIIEEELEVPVNEGLGRFLLNTVKGAAHLAVSPYTAVASGVDKINKYFTGKNVSDSSGGSSKGNTRQSGTNSKGNSRNGENRNRQQHQQTFHSRRHVIREYGEPDTVGFMGRRLQRKRALVVNDFLGSGRRVNFGRHYYERDQDNVGSIWSQRLERAQNNIIASGGNQRRLIRQYRRLVDEWLNERDAAYEQYIKLPRGGALAF